MRRSTCSARPQLGRARLWCSIALLALTLAWAAPAAAAGAGYWHTSGNQILDANGKVVRIAGINWYGFETTDKVIHGMWAQDWHSIASLIKANGFNVVRMPFSDDFVVNPINPTNIGASNGSGPINRDVIGLDSLTIMDKVIQQLGDLGVRVILDNHRSAAGNSADESGLWYTAAYSEQTMIANWVKLVKRYSSYRDPAGNPIVIGVDLRNEPHLNVGGTKSGACWTGDTATAGCPSTSSVNWPKAAERIGNAILAVNPDLLVIVEGAECYSGDCDWWGGNLMGVAQYPVQLSVPNRIVYSAHDYGPALFRQKWFTSTTTCDSLATTWDHYWGYISAQGIAPVLVGEFGANNGAYTGTEPGSQGQWFQCLAGYIKARPAMNWTYWALNGEDDYGLVDAQYNPTIPAPGKLALLTAMQFPLEGGGGVACATPNIPQSFQATAASAGQVDLKWSAVPSPGAGCAVTYSVYRSTNGNAIATTADYRIASGITGTSFSDTTVAASTTYYYLVTAVDVTVGSPPSSKTSATTPQGTNPTYALTVTTGGTGTGSVTSSSGGISCGTSCSATFTSGAVVTLTATAAAGSTFDGWSGACAGVTAATCPVTMSAARTVGATFTLGTPPTYTLTVAKSGTGSGTVTSSGGINCGATCSAAYASGTVVTLTATPASGYSFTGWSGACTGSIPTCAVTMSSAQAVTATFNGCAGGGTLTVTRAGTGGGTVTGSGGLNCGTVCSVTATTCGAVVALTATPAAGSTFTGWTGGGCGTAPTCSVAVSGAVAVTATFTLGTPTPCANPVTFTANTGNFNTTAAACYRTSQAINGWGCANFGGRTVSVNGGTATSTCGAGPFPLAKSADGYTYFSVTAGTYPWASIYLW